MSNQKPIEEVDDLIADLKDDLNTTQIQLEAAQAEVTDLRNQREECPLQWLVENCSQFNVDFIRETGALRVRGTIASDECGYIETPVIRSQRENGKPPYTIHEGDLTRRRRTQTFDCIQMDGSLGRAVAVVQDSLSGGVCVQADAIMSYSKNNRPYVLVSDLPLEEFRALPEIPSDLSTLGLVR